MSQYLLSVHGSVDDEMPSTEEDAAGVRVKHRQAAMDHERTYEPLSSTRATSPAPGKRRSATSSPPRRSGSVASCAS